MKKLHHPVSKILKQRYHERSVYGDYIVDGITGTITNHSVVEWLRANIEGIENKVYKGVMVTEHKMSNEEYNRKIDLLIDKLEAEQKEKGIA